MEADVLSFKEEQFLSVAIAEMKISMKFNGKLYEGKAAGMDFTTPGPKVTKQYSRWQLKNAAIAYLIFQNKQISADIVGVSNI